MDEESVGNRRSSGGVRKNFRAAFRLAAMLLWSLGLLFPAVLTVFLPRRRRILAGARMTRLWATGCRRIINLRVAVFPGPVPRQRGGLIVANHISYLDIFVHASLFGVRFAPKIEMKRWPLVGVMTALSNPVWIDRGNRRRSADSEREMREALLGDVPFLVYPEGTNSDGTALLPFKSTVFESVLRCGAEIRPVLSHYPPAADGTQIPWVDHTGFLPHFWRVMGLKEIDCDVYIMDTVVPRASGRKELALQLHDMMQDFLRKHL